MTIVALCLTYPRASVAEVLGCWERQTYRVPLWVTTDQEGATLGEKRQRAFAACVTRFRLQHGDWVILLDDDDHYAPTHAEAIAEVIARDGAYCGIVAPPGHGEIWPGGELQWVTLTRGPIPRSMRIVDPGPGPHGGIALEVRAWAWAGGYPPMAKAGQDDVALLSKARELGVMYSARATYIHRQDRGTHATHGHGPRPDEILSCVPEPAPYSAQQQKWDEWLSQWERHPRWSDCRPWLE